MLTFFRKIRKGLFDSGNTQKPASPTGRYLLYAAGEVLLVMVGILLALQVNNWNESRKDQITETEVLQNLVECLETNIGRLESQLLLNERSDKSSEYVLTFIENRIPYHDTLDAHIGYASNVDDTGSIFSYFGYEILKNVGMEIIRDKHLKNEVVHLFEETFAVPKGRMDRVGKTYADEVSFRQEYFTRKPGYDFEPIDYDRILNDKKVFSWLYSIKQNRNWINHSLKETLDETQRVLQLIKYELGG